MNVMNVTTPTTPEIFGILVTSFNELVHHLLADHALAAVGLASLTWTFLWSIEAARPHFAIAQMYRRTRPAPAAEVQRYAWRRFWCSMLNFPRAFLLSGTTVVILDYLVLVLMNSMGW